MTVKDLTDMIGISEGSVKTILKDHLGLLKVKSRLVPKTLNFLEKVVALMCVKQCLLTIRINSNASLREKRLGIMLTTLKQPSEYRAKVESRPKRAHQSRSKIKHMMTVFFDFRAVVHGRVQTEKSTSKSFKNQAHDDSFFRFSCCGAL